MPGLLLETMDPLLAPQVPKAEYGFSVLHQKVELEVDFATQSLVGRTEITIVPQRKDLREIKIDARQFQIPRNGVLVNGKVSYIDYEDPNEALHIPDQYSWGVGQYELQRGRLKASTGGTLGNGSLLIEIPDSVHIEEVDPFSDGTSIVVAPRGLGAMSARPSVPADGAIGAASTPGAANSRTTVDQSSQFAPLIIKISFSAKNFRDGLQFVGLGEGDARYPHVYTRHSLDPGVACCVFPCIDDPNVRCTWDISLKFSRTLGDALKKPKPLVTTSRIHEIKKAHANSNIIAGEQSEISLSEEDKLLEMTVVCSGELTNDVVDIIDSSKKTVSFSLTRNVAAQHIGFAIGPFEQIDLSEFREEEDAEKLGQGQAVQVSAFALPGRAEEVRNICSPLASAVDYFSFTFGKYDFPECKMCFVDDQVSDTVHTASLSLCSTRLLISEAIIDPEIDIVRTLVHAVANQWMGVAMIPQTKADRWIVVGIAHFMTGLFMKTLCGTNEYMFRQKALMERLVELDVERPSLYALGTILHLGSFEYEFMALKAPLVLFILDKRMKKATGSQTGGLARIVNKMVTAANTGSGESMVSTDGFAKLCYKISKYKCESFWNQWVTGAGCPKFQITQKYNKKQFQLELTISQKQGRLPERKLERNGFLREFKEEASGVWAGDIQPVFTGPMTIRIHEADGTPYEHIVEIREGIGRFSIPYNTKYKRLKRSRRQKERANAAAGVDITAENQDDVLIYCLGDVLQSREEVVEWGLADWDPENEAEMEKESYEWLRIDADFEWLCEINFVSMKSYMYVSQLQQDRDVVAQQDSINFLQKAVPHPLVSTFLIRTLMDRRYFHGIRTMATEALKTHATTANMCNWVGLRHLEKAFQEFFCYPGTKMPRSNDFSDKKSYYILCAIPRAMAHIRDNNGNCPKEARQFILDQLRFNDNGNNEFSDNHYIANLLSALADSLIPARKNNDEVRFGDDEDDFDPEPRQFKASVLEEIDRYRRMDEWIFSYQNIYTTTAIDCWYRLMEAGIIPTDPLQFMQYLHDGTADLVRIKAFEALVNLGFLRNDMISAYLLNVMSTDSSSFVRRRLYQVFCVGLATIAFGENKALEKPVVAAGADEDNMLVDTDATLEARKSHIARTTTITGALAALKEELGGNEALKQALWKAIRSPVISVSEQADLLDICWILYDPQESWVVQMKYPRYWKAENLGKGIIRFKQTDRIRTELTRYTKNKIRKEKAAQAILDAQNAPVPVAKPAVLEETVPVYIPIPAVPKPAPVSAPIPTPMPTPVPTPVYNPPVPQPPVPTLKFSFKKSSKPEKPASVPVNPPSQIKVERPEEPSSMRPPKRPLSHESRSDSIKSETAEGQPSAKRRKITKLKFTNFSKVQKIQSQPPRPAPVKVPKRPRSPSASFTHPSPVSSNRPSPAPTSSTNTGSPGPAPSGSQNSSKLSITVKPRKPLPDSVARKPLPDSSGRKPLPDSAARKPLPDSSGRNPLPASVSSKAGKPQKPARKVVKLKFTNYDKVRRILSSPPKPLRVKAPKPSPPAPSVSANRA